jgi:hypothetical protein
MPPYEETKTTGGKVRSVRGRFVVGGAEVPVLHLEIMGIHAQRAPPNYPQPHECPSTERSEEPTRSASNAASDGRGTLGRLRYRRATSLGSIPCRFMIVSGRRTSQQLTVQRTTHRHRAMD